MFITNVFELIKSNSTFFMKLDETYREELSKLFHTK